MEQKKYKIWIKTVKKKCSLKSKKLQNKKKLLQMALITSNRFKPIRIINHKIQVKTLSYNSLSFRIYRKNVLKTPEFMKKIIGIYLPNEFPNATGTCRYKFTHPVQKSYFEHKFCILFFIQYSKYHPVLTATLQN